VRRFICAAYVSSRRASEVASERPFGEQALEAVRLGQAQPREGTVAQRSQVLERVRLLKGIRGTETGIHLATHRWQKNSAARRIRRYAF
jgi:hypothetical protein